MLVAGGATSVTTYFALRLTADGTAATGLTITGIDLQYVRSGAAPSAKVDATALAATDSVFAANKAIEIDATDQPGLYRVDWPDAAFVAGVREVILSVKVATAFTEHLRVELDGSATSIENAVWDAILTGASHNTPTSAGRRLRQIEEAFVHASGTIATVTDGHTFTLDAGAVATADYYIGDRLQIAEGTGAGQSRLIVAYSAGRVAILDSDFTVNPDTASLYEIDAADVHVSVSDSDLAEGFVASVTSASVFVLDATIAVADADYYVGELIILTHGTGAGQSREITAYTAGREVTVSPAFDVAPDATTVFHIQAAVSIAEIATELLDLANGVETGVTLRQAQRLMLAALAGKVSGAATTTITIRDTGDGTDRIVATVDADGNRSAVTLDSS